MRNTKYMESKRNKEIDDEDKYYKVRKTLFYQPNTQFRKEKLFLLLSLFIFFKYILQIPERNIEDHNVMVLVMYKRQNYASNLLDNLSQLPNIENYHLVVTQTVDPNDDSAVNITANLLKEKAHFFKSVRHITHFASVFTGWKHGNSYNTIQNFVNGAKYSYSNFPSLKYLILMEDDIEVSSDLLEFVSKSAQLMDKDNDVTLASALYFLMSSHSRYQWQYDKPLKYQSRQDKNNLNTLDPTLISKIRFDGHEEFHTFAWILPRRTMLLLEQDFADMESWIFANKLNNISNQLEDDRPGPLKKYCNCWHLDNYLPARLRGSYFLAPQYFRVTHVGKEGISYPSNFTEPYHPIIYHDKFIKSNQFHVSKITNDKNLYDYLKSLFKGCPDVINCYSKKGEMCGTLSIATCSDYWRCKPCSGKSDTDHEVICNTTYPNCCGSSKCNVYYPTM